MPAEYAVYHAGKDYLPSGTIQASAEDVILCDCGHYAKHDRLTAGYAIDQDGTKLCYNCAAQRELQDITSDETEEWYGYVTGEGEEIKLVTNWTGIIEFPVINVKDSRHFSQGAYQRMSVILVRTPRGAWPNHLERPVCSHDPRPWPDRSAQACAQSALVVAAMKGYTADDLRGFAEHIRENMHRVPFVLGNWSPEDLSVEVHRSTIELAWTNGPGEGLVSEWLMDAFDAPPSLWRLRHTITEAGEDALRVLAVMLMQKRDPQYKSTDPTVSGIMKWCRAQCGSRPISMPSGKAVDIVFGQPRLETLVVMYTGLPSVDRMMRELRLWTSLRPNEEQTPDVPYYSTTIRNEDIPHWKGTAW